MKGEVPAHYLKPDNLHLLWLIPHIGIIAVSFWLMTAFFSWWLAPILGLVVGHSFGCLAFIAHEICHGGAIKNRKLRHFLTAIAFSPFGIGPHLWSRWHNAEHHGNTQHPHLDPDRLFMIDEYRDNPVLKWLYKRSPLARNLVIFGFFSMMMTQHNVTVMIRFLRDSACSRKEKAVIVFQFLAPKAFWIGLTLLLGWPVLLMGYVLPLLVGNAIVISYISTNHFLNPLADESDVLASSLSVTLPKWLNWLDAMHGRFGAHVAHHLFPQAPSRHARKLERQIAKLWPDRFHEMPLRRALKLLWNTPWVYDQDGIKLIDPRKQVQSPTLGNGL
ncbi:MAG: fatty acid desaturase [Fimbriimonadaceae bacterium]|nr:fatty acid desaturase [Fimbriimonadaceae bacterium]